jgi:hypothetical protein
MSVDVFTHAVPQAVKPDGQVQAPATQDCPPPHAIPQPPQFDRSELVSTHWPEQSI